MSREMDFEVDLISGADSLIQVSNIRIAAGKNETTPSSITVTALISATLGGAAIANSSINLSAVSGFDNFYEGTFPDSVSLTIGTTYYVKIVVTADTLVLPRWKAFVAKAG